MSDSRRPKKRQRKRRDAYADIALEAMRPLVRMIATSIGRNCEVVLHDLRTPNASVGIEIAGNLSERNVGAPVNEISRWLLAQGKDVEEKTNKLIRTARGRTLQALPPCSCVDPTARPWGICINTDVTELISVSRIIADMAVRVGWCGATELLDDIAYVVQTVIATEETKTGVRLNIGARADRLRIFQALRSRGVFTLKRAVPRLAEHFCFSRATIYSYLNEMNGAGEEV